MVIIMKKLLLNIKDRWMAFKDIFKDSNDINEKSVVGFSAFAVMVLFAIADIVTGWMGNPLHVNEFIYNSFLWITLGSFGIAEAGKIFGKRDHNAGKK